MEVWVWGSDGLGFRVPIFTQRLGVQRGVGQWTCCLCLEVHGWLQAVSSRVYIDCEDFSPLDNYLDDPPTGSCLLLVTVKEEGMSSYVNYSYRSRPFFGHHAFRRFAWERLFPSKDRSA